MNQIQDSISKCSLHVHKQCLPFLRPKIHGILDRLEIVARSVRSLAARGRRLRSRLGARTRPGASEVFSLFYYVSVSKREREAAAANRLGIRKMPTSTCRIGVDQMDMYFAGRDS